MSTGVKASKWHVKINGISVAHLQISVFKMLFMGWQNLGGHRKKFRYTFFLSRRKPKYQKLFLILLCCVLSLFLE